ncbi:hypothetical protein [Salinibacter sp.]|uniref:hypothetical protein n=1 Tax=Salinibacter sp. TaxID=2065818 RepID=UPI0021E769B4|nr:hypothetical protein [Salinibacter sp.]
MVQISSFCRSCLTGLAGLLALLLIVGGGPRVATAQTPTTTIQNGNNDTRLQLNFDGGLYVPGNLNFTTPADSIPAEGAGTRLMWYPAKAAFRAGRVGRNKDGTQWDAAKVGTYSTAFGVDTKASSFAATAMGTQTTASGPDATAMGSGTTASGDRATAMGLNTEASGRDATAMGFDTEASDRAATAMGFDTEASDRAATAMGNGTTASGSDATAMGISTTAATGFSLSIGGFNSANTSADGTLFVAGNGSGSNFRSDALVLKQDGDLALGPSDPQNLRLHVAKDKPNAGVGDSPGANMVLFENTNTGTRPDVLGLQAGPTNPGSGVTYVSFYQRDGTTIGSIEGNGAGGVNYATSGSDYAEELPVSEGASTPAATDLVGVRGGEVRLSTDGADRVMIASDRPAVTGNTTPSTETDDARRVPVAFIGQVPVRLRGEAEVGDIVVASGRNDGTAQAVSPSEYRRAEHGPIAGQAWSAHSGDGVSTVTVAVGLGRSGAVAERMNNQRDRIAALEAENEEIKSRLAALERQNTSALPAGLTGPWALTLLLGLGALGAGVLWQRGKR